MSAATRILRLQRDDKVVDVLVEIDSPLLDDGAWTCVFRIGWPSGEKAGAATGFDSAQALCFAMQIVAVQLYKSDAHKAGDLYWDEPGSGYGLRAVATLQSATTESSSAPLAGEEPA